MSILLIGGDKLGNIKDKLAEKGFKSIEHVTGRKKSDKKIKISEKTDLVLVLVDYVGHKLSQTIKEQSRKYDVRIAFTKRSWTSMEKTIQKCIEEISNDKRSVI